MKKYLFLLLTFIVAPLYGQYYEQGQYSDINHNSTKHYKLYPTSNMYNFLKLDTKTGVITAVQYAIQGNDEFEYYVGAVFPSIPDSLQVVGRFELYPTRNNYTFLLIDQIDGKVYHVQWSLKKEERFVLPIF